VSIEDTEIVVSADVIVDALAMNEDRVDVNVAKVVDDKDFKKPFEAKSVTVDNARIQF
jgi:hypothetical protein